MIKKPDLSELAKKLDISGIMGGLKSLLNQESEVPSVDPSDAIGTKIAQLSLMMQQMAKVHEEQAKEFAAAGHLLNELYKDLEALRHPPEMKPAEPHDKESSAPEEKKE